jgi:hypothetical protein
MGEDKVPGKLFVAGKIWTTYLSLINSSNDEMSSIYEHCKFTAI